MAKNKLNDRNTFNPEVMKGGRLRLPDVPPSTLYSQQTNFSFGEIMPTLQDSSTEIYRLSASRLENMIVLQDGTLTRRPSTIVMGISYVSADKKPSEDTNAETYQRNQAEAEKEYEDKYVKRKTVDKIEMTSMDFFSEYVRKETPSREAKTALIPFYVGDKSDLIFHFYFRSDINPYGIYIDCFDSNTGGKKYSYDFNSILWSNIDLSYLYYTQVLGTLFIGSPFHSHILKITRIGKAKPVLSFEEILDNTINRLPTAGLLFFQKRLWLAGDKYHVTNVFGSEVGEYDKFTKEDSMGLEQDNLDTLYTKLDDCNSLIDNKADIEAELAAITKTITGGGEIDKPTLQRQQTTLESVLATQYTEQKMETIRKKRDDTQEKIDQFKETAAVSYKFLADKLSEIQWLYEYQNSIIIGTANRCYVMTGRQNKPQLTSTNVVVKTFLEQGVDRVKPLGLDRNSFVMVTHDRTKLLEVSGQITKPETTELTQLVNFFQIDKIKQVVIQRDPHMILWVLTDSNNLYSLTYSKNPNAMAWSRHELAGGLHIHSIQTAVQNEIHTLILSCYSRIYPGKVVLYLDDISNCHKKVPFFHVDGLLNKDMWKMMSVVTPKKDRDDEFTPQEKYFRYARENRIFYSEDLNSEDGVDYEYVAGRLGAGLPSRFWVGSDFDSYIELHPLALPSGEPLSGRFINLDYFIVYTYNKSEAEGVIININYQSKTHEMESDFNSFPNTIIYRPRKRNISMSNIQIKIPHAYHFTPIRIEYKFTVVQNVRF